MTVFAAVAFSFMVDLVLTFHNKYKNKWKNRRLKIFTAAIVVLISAMLLFRFGVVYGKILEGSVYYSTSDIKGYDAGLWLRTNYPDPTTGVVTKKPVCGFGS